MAPRSILITGASSGIGRALAEGYAAPGVRLVLLGRDAGRLDAAAAQCRAAGATAEIHRVDVRDAEALRLVVEAADAALPLDLVVPAAGVSTGLAGVTESERGRRAVLATNLDGAIATVAPLIEPMCARRAGQIAFVGSMAAYRGLPYCPSYSASKAAVHRYAQALRAALRPHGVRVSLIVPGFVTTGMTRDLVAPRLLEMSADDAARRIRAGLAADRAVIAFPWRLYVASRLLGLLPGGVADPLLRRVRVVIPEAS